MMFNLRRYTFAVERRGALLLWEQGMRVSRSSFVTRSEERALRLVCREHYLHHPAPPPQTPRTTAHSIEPIVQSPSQPSLTQLAAHRRTSLLPLRNVNPQPMNGYPPSAPPPPARHQGHSAPPRDILPSWTLLDGERTTEIPQKAPLEHDVASRILT